MLALYAIGFDSGKLLVAIAFTNKATCLLYTSDAADERSSVDLGGRRIIKKKKTAKVTASTMSTAKNTVTVNDTARVHTPTH